MVEIDEKFRMRVSVFLRCFFSQIVRNERFSDCILKSPLSCSRETASTRIFRNDIVVCLREMESWFLTGAWRKIPWLLHNTWDIGDFDLLSRLIYLGCERRLSACSHLANMNSIGTCWGCDDRWVGCRFFFCGTHMCIHINVFNFWIGDYIFGYAQSKASTTQTAP